MNGDKMEEMTKRIDRVFVNYSYASLADALDIAFKPSDVINVWLGHEQALTSITYAIEKSSFGNGWETTAVRTFNGEKEIATPPVYWLDAFAGAELGRRVTRVFMNAVDYADCRKFGRDVLDIESKRAMLNRGFQATLLGAQIITNRQVPVGSVYVFYEPTNDGRNFSPDPVIRVRKLFCQLGDEHARKNPQVAAVLDKVRARGEAIPPVADMPSGLKDGLCLDAMDVPSSLELRYEFQPKPTWLGELYAQIGESYRDDTQVFRFEGFPSPTVAREATKAFLTSLLSTHFTTKEENRAFTLESGVPDARSVLRALNVACAEMPVHASNEAIRSNSEPLNWIKRETERRGDWLLSQVNALTGESKDF